MRSYLSQSPELPSMFSDEVLDVLDSVVRRAAETLHIVDPAERNEVAARIFALYTIGGRTPEEILELTIRLHREGYAPGGRRSDKPLVKRIRTERQRRRLKEDGR